MAIRNISSVRRNLPSDLITPTQIAQAEAAARQILKLVEKARNPGKTVRVYANMLRGGDVIVRGARAHDMQVLLSRMNDMGLDITAVPGGVRIVSEGRMRAVDIQTLPYPGLATDYKPLLVTMLAVAEGSGIVTENLYPGRFRYVEELSKLGADIRTDGHHAIVRGVERLRGAAVVAPDIRAGAALVVAGLAAEGRTVISGIEHIDRGYDNLVGRLVALGALVERVDLAVS